VPQTASLEELFLGSRAASPLTTIARRSHDAVARVYRWEIVKLLAQKRTYFGLGAAMAVPLVFVIVLVLQSGGPNDVPLGRYIRDTGLATPFVVLFFMSIWGFRSSQHSSQVTSSRRSRSTDAQDDPHALARARRDLRRKGAGVADVRSRHRLRDGVIGASRAASPGASIR
jgi:hypothetical protein